jgi:hypothetical protein
LYIRRNPEHDSDGKSRAHSARIEHNDYAAALKLRRMQAKSADDLERRESRGEIHFDLDEGGIQPHDRATQRFGQRSPSPPDSARIVTDRVVS